ncbi:MAG: hypothetical protein EOO46_01410 [Flavobacterium sp.]|nr:MAG: hypothetical protein EOO46_01410 [Flavobacterium sp.]
MLTILETFRYILKGIWSTLKHLADPNGMLVKGVIALVMFFSSIHSFFVIIMALVLMDVVTGLAAAYKSGEAFSSRKLRRGLLEKLCLYLMLLITVFFIDKLLVDELGFARLYFSIFITFLISIYETSSVIENMYKIRPDIPFLSGLLSIFKGMGDKALKSMKKRTDEIVDRVTQLEAITSAEVVPEEVSIPSISGETF